MHELAMEGDVAFEKILVLWREIGVGEIGQSSHRNDPELQTGDRTARTGIRQSRRVSEDY
jgi:hypothetical protein